MLNIHREPSHVRLLLLIVLKANIFLAFSGAVFTVSNAQKPSRIYDDRPPDYLIHVEFVSQKIGWLVGRIGMFKTSDAGRSWTRVGPAIAVGKEIGSIGLITLTPILWIDFTNEFIGWAQRNDGLIRTTDGGQTWALVDWPTRFRQFSFYDEKNGWAFSHNGSIYHTTDGGKSWEKQIEGGPVTAVSANECWALNPKKSLLHTTDAGSTWTETQIHTNDHLIGPPVIKGSEVWILSSECVYHSNDNGRTWQQALRVNPKKLTLNAIGFADNHSGWVVGNNGTILYTDNGGQSWSRQESKVKDDLKGLTVIDQKTVWIVGDRTLLRTMDSGKHWTAEKIPGA